MTEPMFAAFAGFFVALSLVSVVAALLTRSRASAAYAIGVVVFALTLLRTLRYDRTVSWIADRVHLSGWTGGVLFFCAVALRNRGIQTERDRFERLAYLDALTGVANRRTFDETLVRMWNVARRAKVPIAIAMVNIDLDHDVTLAEHMRKVVERDGGITISVGIASRIPTRRTTRSRSWPTLTTLCIAPNTKGATECASPQRPCRTSR